jgi:ribose/xylose/arabinose/galactoside ABC-type transport system permease subunit
MKKNNVPAVLIIASILLITLNAATTDEFDNGFWMQTLSGVLLILAMLLTIRNRNKTN